MLAWRDVRRTVGSKKAREREYARRRYAKQVARMTKAQQRRRRQQMVALVAVGTLVVGGTTAALLSTRGDKSSAAETEYTAPAGTPCDRSVPDVTDLPTAAPDPAVAEDRTWSATIDLCQDGIYGDPIAGTLQVELDGSAAPQAVASFVELARAGFFDGLTCHRLSESENFAVLQCGDPEGTGMGGPGYSFGPIENAPADDFYPAGTIAMARQSGNGESMGSQFFIVYADTVIPSDTAGGYTVFGHVTSGLDVVQMIAAMGTLSVDSETPASTVTIQKVETQ